MANASRAIIIHDGKLLVMHRNKEGSQYYTLVGGRINEGESAESALVREVMEETGLQVTSHRLVYTESHQPPYNSQFIYLCEVAPFDTIGLQLTSEEHQMNRIDINVHRPQWAELHSFSKLPFRTIQLQDAIVKALKKGFPKEPVHL